MLFGENIKLRPLRYGDDELFFKWRNDLDYIKFTKSFRLPKHQALEKSWVESEMNDVSNRKITFIIETLQENEAIGFTQLSSIDWISRNCVLGIAIPDESNRGKGFGKEVMNLLLEYVFVNLNLFKVGLEVTSFNKNSITLYEKLGFKKEGELEQHYFWGGEYHNVLIYGLLKGAFFET